MTLGTGIALAGVWAFAACCAASRAVTNFGMWLGIAIAIAATIILA